MGNFLDKKGRNIEIYSTDFQIIAKYNHEEVGEFSYDVREEGDDYNPLTVSELYSMNVKEGYQKAGIGLEMIKFGVESFENIIYPQDNTENFPTLEGAKFLNAAIRKGIIQHSNPLEDEDEDEDEDFYSHEIDMNLRNADTFDEGIRSEAKDLFDPPTTIVAEEPNMDDVMDWLGKIQKKSE
ncbi:hypothetical protein ACFWMP_19345 [Paenibacillus sp. NPDC058367]|uniref:hypothetical protein n=1 Tax=Paenibacillus sp. NPDC058367 TaxID=3346460 RepID=UPI003668A17E